MGRGGIKDKTKRNKAQYNTTYKKKFNSYFAKEAFVIMKSYRKRPTNILYLDHISMSTTNALMKEGFESSKLYSPNIDDDIVTLLKQKGVHSADQTFEQFTDQMTNDIHCAYYDGCGAITGNRSLNIWPGDSIESILCAMPDKIGSRTILAVTMSLRAGRGYKDLSVTDCYKITMYQINVLFHNYGYEAKLSFKEKYPSSNGIVNMLFVCWYLTKIATPPEHERRMFKMNDYYPNEFYGFRPPP